MRTVSINDYELMRAKDGRMLGGVAAGLAKTSGLDVTLVRLCIGAMILSGFGVPAYILMWIIVPEESPSRGRFLQPAPEQMARIIRISLVVLAGFALLNKVGDWGFANPHSGVGLDGAIGLVLIGIGIAVLFSRHRPAVTTVGDAVTSTFREFRTTVDESRPRRYADDAMDDELDEEPEPEPTRVATAIVDGDVRSSGGAALGWARVIGWFCMIWWTLSAIAFAGLWAIGAVSVKSPIVVSVATWLVFVAVLNTLVHAKFARAILPSLALLLIPVGVATASTTFNGAIGYQEVRPQSVNGTVTERVAAGYMKLDLTKTQFAKSSTTVNARVGAGYLDVTVPNDVSVTVHTKTTSGGGFEIFGRPSNGFSPDSNGTYAGCEGAPKLTLNLRSGAGFVRVHRANDGLRPVCSAAA